ncbi:MAG TPA: UDP-N-acetylmuramoyl-L-alanine--D-glutamate ligase [Flavobacterium sp.]|nr:UDP-N-acetylmuramoyl-L-alanine--D-glutamate ligase [Flavobacterium sp.]
MKKLVILGGGESGVGTALLAAQQGFEVFVSDYGAISEDYQQILTQNHIEWEEKQHSLDKILRADLVVKSPGISHEVNVVKRIKERGISIISEIEFAYRYNTQPTIGITGSNGKTTTTMWMEHILKNAGLNVSAAGNIGDSYAKQVAKEPDKLYVLELSSFQLDDIKDYAPHIAVITNITPDHLDRYNHQFENYVQAKFNITKNQSEKDYLIYDADDSAITKWLDEHQTKANLLPFSTQRILTKGAYIKDNTITTMINNEEQAIIATEELAVGGKHNQKNAMAASLAAQLMRVRNKTIRESLSNFSGAPHRLEKVARIGKVQYINDSKATNVNATYFALESVNAPVIWIAGGVDKGNDYDELLQFVNEKVKAIICLGIDNEKIKNTFGKVIDVILETSSMDEAVKIASKIAEAGDQVLLSPACASFDLFENYQDRGDQFKQAVSNL